ncbi:putative Ig domain-containing protein, partial [Opitutales bacterium]|nr:putative Ig domain-containing protein [Opitutales bacterium]
GNAGVSGSIYGDELISNLVGGSGGGHSAIANGNSGGGGGAIGFKVSGSFSLESNGSISVRGGVGQPYESGLGAGGSGGAIRIEAASILNNGILDARGGNVMGAALLAGAGGGGRVSLLSKGSVDAGIVMVNGGNNSPQDQLLQGRDGTFIEVTSPTLPIISPSSLTYGSEVSSLDLGQSSGLSYTVSGLPNGLSNKKAFYPSNIPGAIAWYRSDHNESFTYYSSESFERNDSVAVSNQLAVYSFNESNQSLTFDETGNGYHGSFVGDVIKVSGKFNGGLNFDGLDDALVLPKIDSLSNASAFTISIWFNRFHDIQSSPTIHSLSNVLFAQSSGTFDGNLEIGTEGSEVKVYLNNGTDHVFASNDANISNNTWHHLSVTYGNDLSVYLDGAALVSNFEPSILPGLELWLDADDNSSINLSSNAVSQWRDKSGNNNHLTQSTAANRPSLATKAIQFDGVDDGFTLTNDLSHSNLNVFFVVKGHGYLYSNNGTERTLFYNQSSGRNLWWRINGNEFYSNAVVAGYSDSVPQLLEFSLNSGSASLHVNGVQALIKSSVTGNFKIDRIGLKYDGNTGVSSWSGDMMEIIATSLTSNRSRIEGYLAHKWGLTSELPLGHPYKSSQISGPLTSFSDSTLSIGLSRPFSDQTGDFNGSIDDLRIFNRELNPSEVVNLYNNGNGDLSGSTRTKLDDNRILIWNDFSGSERLARSSNFVTSPRSIIDPQNGKAMVSLDFNKTLGIDRPISMPMSIMMVGRERGSLLPNREFFTNQGWRLANNGMWTLRKWDNNDPNLSSTFPSNMLSILGWTFDRYGYELWINGTNVGTSSSSDWLPDVLFDRINSTSDLFLLPRSLEVDEREKLEGYFAHKWNLYELLPPSHLYKTAPPVDGEGLVLTGTPNTAGSFNVQVNASNQWGSVDQNFTLLINPIAPQIQTQQPLQVGASSARLMSNLLETGGETVQVFFAYGTDAGNLDQNTSSFPVSLKGIHSQLLTGLAPNSTYFYQAQAVNLVGTSNGDSLSRKPLFDWQLQSLPGGIVIDSMGRKNGTIGGDVTADGNAVQFDGDDDYVSFGDLDELDSPNFFTISLWFNKEDDLSNRPSINGINNILVSQSSGLSNDNLEIGTSGSKVEIFIDSGSLESEAKVSYEAGISLNTWHHLALVYGSDMRVYIDGVRINTWTQFNSRLESSVSSPFSLGIAQSDTNKNGEFNGQMRKVKVFDSALSEVDVAILAELGSIQTFTTNLSPSPPRIIVKPASDITESNATIHYELISYDESQPEIIMYWGPVDHGDNEGLWNYNQSLGFKGTGEGSLNISGFSPGELIYYRVRAKGSTFSGWSDQFGEVRMVDKPRVSILPANQITLTSANLRGQVLGNGGVTQIRTLSEPLVSDGLIAHWRFDEGNGQEAYDSTGFSSVAQIFDGVSWVDGKGGQWKGALRFDGSSTAYLKAGSFNIDGDMSFSGWVYKENLGNGQRMIDFGDGENSQNLLISNHSTTSDAEWSIRQGSDPEGVTALDYWKLNEWILVTATVDSSGVMKLFRNGELKGSALGHKPNSLTRSNHFIGKSNWATDDNFYGMMDDLRVYDRALSLEDIASIYSGDLQVENSQGGQNPNITLYWGEEDAGQSVDVNSSSSTSWDAKIDLGVHPVGQFSTQLFGLQKGKTYYYRVKASNAAGSSVMTDVATFSTGSFGFDNNSFADGEILLWLDGSDINGDGNFTNEPLGGMVDQWRDKSGFNRHAGNGNGPELRVENWNSLSTLSFNGFSNYLRVSDSSELNVGNDMTLFIVAKGNVLSENRPIISKLGEDQLGWQFRRLNNEFATFTIRGTTGNDDLSGSTPINGSPHVWSVRKGLLKRTQWVDGNLEYNVNDTGVISSTSSDIVIAARDQSGITALGGVEIGEVILYDHSLSDEQVAQLQGHLAHKWGLVDNLPSVHPYKKDIPLFENRPEILLKELFSIKKGVSLNLPIQTNRIANNYIATGLPNGLDINSTTGLISGIPLEEGSVNTRIEVSNQFGTFAKDIQFLVTDFTSWDYSTDISFPGYSGLSTLNYFPVYIEFNSSLPGFSYSQFASQYGYDLRFLENNGSTELPYEPVMWNVEGKSGFWVLLSSLDQNTTIRAIWGNGNAVQEPSYCNDGSVWKDYDAVWHMDGTSLNTIRESRVSGHGSAYNFDNFRVPGVIGNAISFDGFDDYVDIPLAVHPRSDGRQLNLSFWSYGGPSLSPSKTTTLLESGSALGRSLNIHFPHKSLLYWEAGSQNSLDSISKEFSGYQGQWDYWTFQKDRDSGVMNVYRNGLQWHTGYDKTRPFDGNVENFRLGAGRNGGSYWDGLLDELRLSSKLKTADFISASYESQKPEGNFLAMQTVSGPPLLIPGQVAEGYADDSNLSYFVQVFPSANTYSGVGLPAGVSLNSVTGEISGVPLQGGNYAVTITASNANGQDQGIIYLSVVEKSGFSHNVELNCSSYTGSTLKDFPLLVKLDNTVSNFSLKSFSSENCYDLRFYDQFARELEYEIDEINRLEGSLSAWVKVKDFDGSSVISAYWGNPLLAKYPPIYTGDGSTWSNGYRGVWHLRSFEGIDVLTDSSFYRNHAYDSDGFKGEGIIGSSRSFSGGVDKYLRVPSAFSIDDLHEQSFTFSTWIKLDESLPIKAEDSVFASGFLHPRQSQDAFFDDINKFNTLTPSGARIMQAGPRQGLFFNSDSDFMSSGIGISRVDNYMSLFEAIFTPQESGTYKFRIQHCDDANAIWLDLDQNGIFAKNGGNGNELILLQTNYQGNIIKDSSSYTLSAGEEYKIAFAHGEGGGGSRLIPSIKTPSSEWQIVDPSDPAQDGMFSVPFDGNISENISPYVIARHGGVERIALRSGNISLFHDLETGTQIVQSTEDLVNSWKHLMVTVDSNVGTMRIYEDGNETGMVSYSAVTKSKPVDGQDWYFGQGLIPSSFDEMRLANKSRSSDWALASYLNQKPFSNLPTVSVVNGPRSFISISSFDLLAEQNFEHNISVTGSPIVYTGIGLPSGLVLNSNIGNLTGTPTLSGQYSSKISALYNNGTRADQNYSFSISSGAPEIDEGFSTQFVDSTTLSVSFTLNATGGEDPQVYILADTIDHGTNFYSWTYRIGLGQMGLGNSVGIIGGLAPDRGYYIRIYAENSAGKDWSGKQFFKRTQPNKEDLPIGLGIWFDSTDIYDSGQTSPAVDLVETWKDKSGKSRNILNRYGNPSIKLDGFGGKPVVDFDGNDQLYTDHNFAADFTLRNAGYVAFGVSRYTGGANNRVISSVGANWLMGHHGNRNARYYLHGWVYGGFEADTKFHIWEISHEGLDQNADPVGTVYIDGTELAQNRSSAWWGFYPSQLSFGAFDNLREASKCQVAEFILFEGGISAESRLKIEGYLSNKWGISLPSSHPWGNNVPTFGEVVESGVTPIVYTNPTDSPTVINRNAANLKNTSASLTGLLVDTGLGILPTNPVRSVSTNYYNTPGLSIPVLGEFNATNISHNGANLTGSLLSTGGEPPSLTVVWGDEDHGTNINNIENWDFNETLLNTQPGQFSVSAGGLNQRTSYFFRILVTNSVHSFVTSKVGVFVTSSSGNTLPNSVLWLDANDSSITDSTWPDKSGLGNDAIKNGSVGISSHELNGLKVMEYNGTNNSYHQ